MKFWEIHDAWNWWRGLSPDERQWWLTLARTIRPFEAWLCHRRQCQAGWYGPDDPFDELAARRQSEVLH